MSEKAKHGIQPMQKNSFMFLYPENQNITHSGKRIINFVTQF